MSQLRRQVAVGAVIAILSAFGLGVGVNFFLPSQAASSTITETISSATSTATSTFSSSSTSSAVTSSSSSTSSSSATSTTTGTTTVTYTSSTASSTSPTPTFGRNPSVEADPSLAVGLVQSVLLSSNATQIAERLATVLGAAPVTRTGATSSPGPNDGLTWVYTYSTASGSQIAITFVQSVFYQLDYSNPVRSAQSGTFTPLNASASALRILAGMGIPTATDRLRIQIEDFSSLTYTLQWGSAFTGVPVDGTLARNADGSYFIQGNSLYFEFDPQSGTPTRIILISPYWYAVGTGFPLNISALQAAQIAASYAQGLGMTTIGTPEVSFVVVHGSLYYVVTVGDSVQTFDLVVNPRTGEVGLPG